MVKRIEQIYYEDEHGNHVPHAHENAYLEVPKGARYQVAQFARQLRTDIIDLAHAGEGSPLIATMNSSYPSSLVLAMVRPSLKERFVQLLRYGRFAPVFDFDTAILKSALSCERCLNSLLHRHGCGDGYRQGSPQWVRCGTSCTMCQPN